MTRKPPQALLAISLAAALSACGATPQPTAATRTMTVSLAPAADKPVIDAAAAVFSKRLKALGITNFTMSVGATMEFVLQVPLTFDGTLVDEVLKRPGVFEFVTWPANHPEPSAGLPVPAAATLILRGVDGITSANVVTDVSGTAAAALNIKLTAVGSEAIASFTTHHIGEYLALTLDGRVVAAAIVDSPITAGDLRMTFPTNEPPPIPLVAIAAMMTSGPLPDAWTAQP